MAMIFNRKILKIETDFENIWIFIELFYLCIVDTSLKHGFPISFIRIAVQPFWKKKQYKPVIISLCSHNHHMRSNIASMILTILSHSLESFTSFNIVIWYDYFLSCIKFDFVRKATVVDFIEATQKQIWKRKILSFERVYECFLSNHNYLELHRFIWHVHR